MKGLDGSYIGIGLGDVSSEVLKIKQFINRKFSRFRLLETEIYDAAMEAAVRELQTIYKNNGTLTDPFIPGVVNLATKYAIGYLKKDVILPIHFSVEGHMSDMWIGPAAYVGEVLRAENRALHFPTGYDNRALPFNNKSGVEQLVQRVGATEFFIDGKVIKFPPGTPWTASAFSQGAMIWCDFYRQYLMPGKPLHWRLKDLRAVICCGNPDREKGVCVDWIPDKPDPDRQGIMDDENRMVNTPWYWLELARKGDMYTDNESSGERGLNKTAIAKIITQNKWSGGPAGLLARVTDLLVNPIDDVIPITLALYDAIRFGAGGIRAHGGYDMEPAVQFCRERLAA
ncbi:lysin B [Mycobacterium phage Labelle]|nr:lysin B [Mycobacterium phage Labelle]